MTFSIPSLGLDVVGDLCLECENERQPRLIFQWLLFHYTMLRCPCLLTSWRRDRGEHRLCWYRRRPHRYEE